MSPRVCRIQAESKKRISPTFYIKEGRARNGVVVEQEPGKEGKTTKTDSGREEVMSCTCDAKELDSERNQENEDVVGASRAYPSQSYTRQNAIVRRRVIQKVYRRQAEQRSGERCR